MRKTPRTWPMLLAAGLALVAGCGLGPAPRHTGVVVELADRRPIEGVRLTLDCRKGRLIHGTELIRNAEAVSGADGRFTFAPEDLKGCSIVSVQPAKEGFVSALGIPDSGVTVRSEILSEVPQFVSMVRESDVNQLRLDGLFKQSNAERVAPPGPMLASDYLTVNTPFHESVCIARSPAEVGWVKERYCARLQNLWERVPPDEQARLLAGRYSNVTSFPDVLAYCRP